MRIYKGLTLIELVLSMVIVAISLTGIVLSMQAAGLGAYNVSDPLMRQQALYMAESHINEIINYPFSSITNCGISATFPSGVTNATTGCTNGGQYWYSAAPAANWTKWAGKNLDAYTVGFYINSNTPYTFISGVNTAAGVLIQVTVSYLNESVRLSVVHGGGY